MFDLKKQEKILVIILVLALAIGTLVLILKKTRHPVKVDISRSPEYVRLDELVSRPFPGLEKPVNINTAGLRDLMMLDGIGQILAQRILDYRTENGPFRSKEDIKKVKGIGDKLFGKITGSISAK